MLKVSHVENAGYACWGRGRVDQGGASHLGSLADLAVKVKNLLSDNDFSWSSLRRTGKHSK